MIRYLLKDDIYYSLNDVSNWLIKERLLTHIQSQVYNLKCRAYVMEKLANAYQQQCVYQHQEPIILPLNDYFIHWVVWAKLLILLPEEVRSHQKVETLSLILDNPETVYLQSRFRHGLNLVNLSEEMRVASRQ